MRLPPFFQKMFTVSIIGILLINTAAPAKAEESPDHPKRVLFINQVRGGECCDPGSLSSLQTQIQSFNNANLSATFLLRYDALLDFSYTKLLKTHSPTHELGVFLEITPSLAKKSGVAYLGNEAQWYQAQFAYPLGYSVEDRKKIIDTLFAQFLNVYGEYPKSTGGWIVDTTTLNYIQERYDTEVHQITREQWGTDSYTLSGGVVHYPYFASKKWSFLPSTDQNSGLLIIRQTVSDPLDNYGDSTSSYTSQPNDYSRGSRGFSYFSALLEQMLAQKHNSYSIAILGLENSMPSRYQDEYLLQIESIAQKKAIEPNLRVLTASQFQAELEKNSQRQEVTIVSGKDLTPSEASRSEHTWWVNAPIYRVRVLQNDRSISITDIRVYSAEIQDPYTQTPSKRLGYWVAPFVLDGSRYYQDQEEQPATGWKEQLRSHVKKLLLPELRYKETKQLPVKPDTQTTPNQVRLPDIKSGHEVQISTNSNQEKTLVYLSTSDENVLIRFSAESFEVESQNIQSTLKFELENSPEPLALRDNSQQTKTLSWKTSDNKDLFGILIPCPSKNNCQFEPFFSSTKDWPKMSRTFYPYFLPEVIERRLDNQNSVLYAHNSHAVSGKNPVRFVLIPKDEFGYATVLENTEPQVSSTPEIRDFVIHKQHAQDGIIFIDAVENKIGKYQVTIQYTPEVQKTQEIFFAPNCKLSKTYCLTHPVHTWWYLKSMFYTKLRQI